MLPVYHSDCYDIMINATKLQ